VSAERVRVLAVTPDYPPAFGGIQLLFHRVLAHASRLQTRVVTIPPPAAGGRGPDPEEDVVRAPRIADHRLEVLLMNGLAIREAYRFRPDLVFCAHIVATPAAAVIASRLGVPTVLYVHGKEVGASPGIARFGLRRSSAVIAVSRYTRSLALVAGAEEAKVHVIPPGVDWMPRTGKPRLERPTIITVARLEDRYKGHDVITRALPLIRARVPDVQWVVIGDGQLREEILDLAEANGVTDSLVMLGSVADSERNAWLDRAHVFAMPSRLPAGQAAGEGFGIVYLEAGVHGLPVVAGNVGGALDAVVDGVTGLLVDPTSSVAIADAIADLLLDRQLAERMGDAGAARAREFSFPAISARVEELLLSVASAPSATLRRQGLALCGWRPTDLDQSPSG
jgi:phosphatidylinositol alpha-1,6-mannosyltransferase